MFCCVALQSPAFADNEMSDSLKKDSITFNTAYLKEQYTNKQLTNFNLELLNALDRVVDTFSGGRHAEILAFLVSSFIVEKAGTALHEVGHGLRAKSYGIDYQFLLDSDDTSGFEKNENFFDFF
jgi:hypothetical protein